MIFTFSVFFLFLGGGGGASCVLVKTKETSGIFNVLPFLFLFWGKASITTILSCPVGERTVRCILLLGNILGMLQEINRAVTASYLFNFENEFGANEVEGLIAKSRVRHSMGRCSESFFKQLCQQVHFNPALQYPCLPSKCQFLPGAECPRLSPMRTAEELHVASSVLGRIRIRDSNSSAELEIKPKMNFVKYRRLF